jgi:squalene cyclase
LSFQSGEVYNTATIADHQHQRHFRDQQAFSYFASLEGGESIFSYRDQVYEATGSPTCVQRLYIQEKACKYRVMQPQVRELEEQQTQWALGRLHRGVRKQVME